MKFSSKNIFVFSFCATLLIFGLIKTSPKEKIINPIISRLLATKTTDEMREEMCEKSSSDLKQFYEENKPDYTFTPEGTNDFLNELIMKFANKSQNFDISKDQIIDYAKTNIIYIIALVLFVLLFVLWIPYIFCVCKKKCCCVSDSCSDNLRCFLFIAIILAGAVMICCFIGYSQNTDILNGIYGLGCSILKMEQHLIYGDEYKKEKPYWIGLSDFMGKLLSTKEEIQKIGDNSKNICNSLNVTQILFNELKTDLKEEWQNKAPTKITNPIPDGGEITPNYLNNYGPDEDSSTGLGSMKTELSAFEDITISKLSKIVDVIDINDRTQYIRDNMDEIRKELNETLTKVETTISSGIGDYYEQFDDIDSIVRKCMNILFSLNLAIVIAFAVSIVFQLCLDCGTLLICISWFFIYIFMLLSFLLGTVLGLVSSFIKDASSAVKYVMNNTDLIHFSKIDIVDICLNGNGSLANTQIIPISFDTSIIDNIYNLEKNISAVINIIDSYNYSSAQVNDIRYNQYFNVQKNTLELTQSLKEIQVYINSNVEGTKVQTPINDKWVVDKDDCGEDYLPKNTLRNLLLENDNDPHCLVITEWKEAEISSRYSSLEPINPIDNIQGNINNYYKSIVGFMTEGNALIEGFIDKNKEFNNSFIDIKNSEIELLNKTIQTIKPLRKIFEEMIQDGSIFETMNCKFIKRDSNKVLEVLYNEFGGTFKTTSNVILAISCSELVLTIFVLIIMKSLKAKSVDLPNYSKYSQANN